MCSLLPHGFIFDVSASTPISSLAKAIQNSFDWCENVLNGTPPQASHAGIQYIFVQGAVLNNFCDRL